MNKFKLRYEASRAQSGSKHAGLMRTVDVVKMI